MAGKRKKRMSLSMGLFAAVFVFLMVTLFLPQEKVLFLLEEGSLTVSHVRSTIIKKEADFSRQVSLEDVTDIRLLTENDLGEASEEAQIDTKKCAAGTWRTPESGEFDVIVYKSIPVYVWIEEAGERPLLMNLENTDLTESFCESLQEYVKVKGNEAITEREAESEA